ncbi:MAG: glycosyltransferase family 9 protein [Bacteroidota bacterium]
MKFLIIRFSSIGDIILTTPVIRCLKKQVTDAEIHMVTRNSFAGILAFNPYIDKLHLLGSSLDETINELKKENFDYVIDLHHNIRTLKVKRALGVKSFSFNKLNIEKFIYTSFKVNILPPVHIVDRSLDTVKSFGVKNDGEGLDYFIPEKDMIKEGDLPLPHQLAYVGVVIGAALATKKLPLHKLQELCQKLDFPIVLMGGPEDKQHGDKIAAVDPEKIYNSCGKFNLNESAGLVKKAKLIISHDTGLMHIAAAFKKPIISIWGNTVPAFGMTPYYGNYPVFHREFGVSGLNCRPCSKIGYKKCPRGHFKCMNQQDISAIILQALKILKG